MFFSILNPGINGRGPGDPILESTDGKENDTEQRRSFYHVRQGKSLQGTDFNSTFAYGDVNIAGGSETSETLAQAGVKNLKMVDNNKKTFEG
ncbi:hypothetical protein MCOR03_008287 [Pyricularia oryzae]|nr:hypothetical protein MCOR32_008025 [Pyricularia oryzae]KAI6395676.1 hypothetical protein MCOR20_010163 [Pyricularia oryzae]KAI6493860.1 hypothetical protein MCOR11_006053 [Pyricularia oryzae]KAI6531495.1 hypothetical protein MCOR16_004265 [Pyricularia oryzae]KAI6552642.1 hypothetical protein MCOR03_008287 [Pyricularia oryzae]